MDYITIQEAEKKWGIGERRIQILCNEGRVEGALRFGRVWMIPKEAKKPADARIKSAKYTKKKDGVGR